MGGDGNAPKWRRRPQAAAGRGTGTRAGAPAKARGRVCDGRRKERVGGTIGSSRSAQAARVATAAGPQQLAAAASGWGGGEGRQHGSGLGGQP